MKIDYYVSSKRGTGMVTVENEVIVDTPPIWRKFIRQPLDNLLFWLKKYKIVKLEQEEKE